MGCVSVDVGQSQAAEKDANLSLTRKQCLVSMDRTGTKCPGELQSV